MAHNERCKLCKARVLALLRRLYGSCVERHKLDWPTLPSDYQGTALADTLDEIFGALQAHRGFQQFVRAKKLAPCDYLVAGKFLVEFDESQHFTSARLVSFNHYPAPAQLRFSVPHWKQTCLDIDARDNDPAFRDEQRAWYDTLRDLVPALHGMGPTVRLRASAIQWCGLDANVDADVECFRNMIDG